MVCRYLKQKKNDQRIKPLSLERTVIVSLCRMKFVIDVLYQVAKMLNELYISKTQNALSEMIVNGKFQFSCIRKCVKKTSNTV